MYFQQLLQQNLCNGPLRAVYRLDKASEVAAPQVCLALQSVDFYQVEIVWTDTWKEPVSFKFVLLFRFCIFSLHSHSRGEKLPENRTTFEAKQTTIKSDMKIMRTGIATCHKIETFSFTVEHVVFSPLQLLPQPLGGQHPPPSHRKMSTHVHKQNPHENKHMGVDEDCCTTNHLDFCCVCLGLN